jgi:hypothetical protein
MFFTFLNHAWLSFRRAHYFERSLGIKLIIGFVGLILLWYINLIASILPGLLQRFFPESPAHEVFFSFLAFLFLSDQIIRLFGQNIPRHKIAPYLHLPVPKNKLAAYTLIRSWFSPFNIYLLVLFFPFFRRIISPDFGPENFWLTMVGLFLLSGASHALVNWAKTSRKKGLITWYVGLALSALVIWLFPEEAMEGSRQLGLALMKGQWVPFIVFAIIIVVLQYLAKRNLRRSYSLLVTPSLSKDKGSGFMSRLFSKIPVFGLFWDLEWKLLSRNKRSRANVYQWPFAMVIVVAMVTTSLNETTLPSFYPILLMFMGSFGFYHLQYIFSWESHFFDFIATRNLDLRRFILAKYYFYAGVALLQFLLLMPFVLIVQPGISLMLLSLLLYAIGPVFALLIYQGASTSTRLDPNKKAIFNFEGTSGTLFISILLIFASLVPVAAVGLLLPWGRKISILITTGMAGLAFIITHHWWISATARRFAKKKYINLNKYREK